MPQVTEEENIAGTETITYIMNTLFAIAKSVHPVLSLNYKV